MKPALFKVLAFALLFFAASCSEDETLSLPNGSDPALASRPLPNQPKKGLRIKKVTQTTHYSSTDVDTFVANYNYQGTTLASIHYLTSNGTSDAFYYYNGLKVTSVDYLSNGLPDGSEFIYYNGNFIDHIISGENSNQRSDYTFVDGHLSTKNYYSINGSSIYLFETETYTFSNGNLVQLYTDNHSSTFPNSRTVYTYDNKNNPLKGMNSYLQQLLEYEGFNGLSINNPVTRTSYFPADVTDPDEQYYEITYNSKDYPVHIQRFSENSFLISDTVIEYLGQ